MIPLAAVVVLLAAALAPVMNAEIVLLIVFCESAPAPEKAIPIGAALTATEAAIDLALIVGVELAIRDKVPADVTTVSLL